LAAQSRERWENQPHAPPEHHSMTTVVRRQLIAALSIVLVAILVLSQSADTVADRNRDRARDVAAAPRELPAALQREELFDGRMFVAYYGTVGTPALGVLGEASPWKAMERVERAAAPFRRNGLDPQPVFELIVTIADAHPGKDGDYNHDVPAAAVRQWVLAARRAGALLVLDIQPGRGDFPSVAKRWEWALREPHVGLAIDPEWRMGPGEVPGRVIGSTGRWEINLTTRWLEQLVVEHDLPQKVFIVHQFRTDMVRDIDRVQDRRMLAEIQHVDGFGTPGQKLDTYFAVARPDRFQMGFKLFYDEDRPRMSATQLMRRLPRVEFVSFQ
jgi:hypothetical protein